MTPQPPVPNSTVLVVDDEKSIRVTLRAFLLDAGYAVETADDAQQARTLLKEKAWDVVVTDIVLPGLSGIDLLKSIRVAGSDTQVIMMTGEPTMDTAAEAVRAGACDYLTKPVNKQSLLRAVATAARFKAIQDDKRDLEQENRDYQHRLENTVKRRTEELRQALHGTIHAMAATVESRDPYTAGHQQRVAELARRIAEELNLPGEDILATYYAGVVHDLGKIGVPAEILCSPAPLSQPQKDLIRLHPNTAYEILRTVPFPWPLAEIVRQHHERMDGSGYPQGLTGAAILIEARILAIADVVEAMASHRPYRPALGIAAALQEITEHSGTLYDADAVAACLHLFHDKGFAFPTSAGANGPLTQSPQEKRVQHARPEVAP